MVRVLLQLPAFDIIFTKVQSFLETPYRVCVWPCWFRFIAAELVVRRSACHVGLGGRKLSRNLLLLFQPYAGLPQDREDWRNWEFGHRSREVPGGGTGVWLRCSGKVGEIQSVVGCFYHWNSKAGLNEPIRASISTDWQHQVLDQSRHIKVCCSPPKPSSS